MKARTICFVALTVLMVTVTATHPLSAQRRTTNQSVVKQNTDKENKNREQAEKKAVRSTERHTVSGNPFNRRSTTGQNSNESPNVKTTAPLRRNNKQAAPQERRSLNRKTPDVKDNKTTVRRKPQTSKQNVTRRSRAEKQRESFRNNQPSEIRKGKTTNVSPRARNDHHRKVYKLDAGDNR